MNKSFMTAMYSISHFFVDLSCAFLILRYAFNNSSENILIYNFCAFAIQMPIGIIIDRFGHCHRAATAGCLMIIAGFIMVPADLFMLSSVLAGIGNALFHVGGGVYVLENYRKSGALGVFVSPGAIGLYIGTMLSGAEHISAMLPISFMLVCALGICMLSLYITKNSADSNCIASFDINISGKISIAAVLFALVVVIRSFGGFSTEMSWKATAAASLGAVCVTAAGKALGGFLSDYIGNKRAAAISMTASAVLYAVSANPFAGILAILCFNMSMPITLRAVSDVFRNAKGFSFGLLTFALFLGYIPSYCLRDMKISSVMMSVLCIISSIMLILGFAIMEKEQSDDRIPD